MQNVVTPWRKDGDWKARYSKLYSSRQTLSKEESTYGTNRISFLGTGSSPHASLMLRRRAKYDLAMSSNHNTWLWQNDVYNNQDAHASDLGVNETLLLDKVRARNRVLEDAAQDRTLELPCDDVSDDDTSSEACVHGLSMRLTERSVSRSRVSRISTRRDMDIPSILAFTAIASSAPVHLGIPAFKKMNAAEVEATPRWSIRRSVCPVCSQKWRDRSSITNVKNSGLKRNSSLDSPSVIAPARLRTSIAIGYVPRPALAALDKDAGVGHGGLRNNSASWQLTRARRFRAPKLRMLPLEATAPSCLTAPHARKDLDIRVNRFLKE